IRATTPADQKTVVRWAFATMALDPDVASMAAVSPAQREAINQKAGDVVTNLLAGACSQPVQQALMFEGPGAARTAFEAWARWAIGHRRRTARDAGRGRAAAIPRHRQVDVADAVAGIS